MSNGETAGAVEYALVDYDVHKDPKAPKEHLSTYAIIYKHLDRISIKFSDSVYIVRGDRQYEVELAFANINKELREKGLKPVTHNITETAEKALEKMQKRSRMSLNERIREIGKSLLGKIERLEKKFNEVTGDVNDHLYKGRLVIAWAKRELDMARGVATMFLMDGDASVAMEIKDTLEKIEREQEKRGELKAKAKAEAAGMKAVEVVK